VADREVFDAYVGCDEIVCDAVNNGGADAEKNNAQEEHADSSG